MHRCPSRRAVAEQCDAIADNERAICYNVLQGHLMQKVLTYTSMLG